MRSCNRVQMCAEPRRNGQIHDGLKCGFCQRDDLSCIGWERDVPDLLAGSNRVQGAHHHLACPGAVRVFRQAVFQQLRIGQDDPELVVQEMEKFCQVAV